MKMPRVRSRSLRRGGVQYRTLSTDSPTSLVVGVTDSSEGTCVCFLVRLKLNVNHASDRWKLTLSLKDRERCNHFL